MDNILYWTKEQILQFHQKALLKDGGLEGIKFPHVLESIVERPRDGYGEFKRYQTPVEIAAAYLYFIATGHAFQDGNKRAATIASLAYLRIYNAKLNVTSQELIDFVLDVSDGRHTIESVIKYFRKHQVRRGDFQRPRIVIHPEAQKSMELAGISKNKVKVAISLPDRIEHFTYGELRVNLYVKRFSEEGIRILVGTTVRDEMEVFTVLVFVDKYFEQLNVDLDQKTPLEQLEEFCLQFCFPIKDGTKQIPLLIQRHMEVPASGGATFFQPVFPKGLIPAFTACVKFSPVVESGKHYVNCALSFCLNTTKYNDYLKNSSFGFQIG